MQPLEETPGNPVQAVPAAATGQMAPPPPVAELDGPAGPEPRLEQRVAEIGGPAGPEPSRYGDWERRGRCIDF